MADAIDTELAAVQQLCRVSWSENEIIERLEQIRQMRKQEMGHVVALHSAAELLVHVKTDERWGKPMAIQYVGGQVAGRAVGVAPVLN